jgi:hypothetical protein
VGKQATSHARRFVAREGTTRRARAAGAATHWTILAVFSMGGGKNAMLPAALADTVLLRPAGGRLCSKI